MGRFIQITLLTALFGVSWAIIIANPETSYLGVKLSLLPIIRVGAISAILASIFAFLILGISEIPNLSPENKSKLNNLYGNIYTIIWVGATAVVSLQVYIFVSNYFISNFILKWGMEAWQGVAILIFSILFYSVAKKYGFFKEDSK